MLSLVYVASPIGAEPGHFHNQRSFQVLPQRARSIRPNQGARQTSPVGPVSPTPGWYARLDRASRCKSLQISAGAPEIPTYFGTQRLSV